MTSRQRNIVGAPALNRIREDSTALKRLAELEEVVKAHRTEGGSLHFSEGECRFIQSVRRRHSAEHELTAEQRDRIKQLWESMRKAREAP